MHSKLCALFQLNAGKLWRKALRERRLTHQTQSCWEGFCDREDDDELFEAPKGYYCTSCLENAEAESMLKDIGGCR